MRRSFSLVPVLFLSVLLSTCGGGGDESGGGSYNPLWISIDTFNLDTTVTTSSVDLYGTAYCGDACPPGDTAFGYCPQINNSLPAPVMDISWSNKNTGATGIAVHGVSGSCSCLFSYCFTSYSHRWAVYGGVPLALADNVIEVTASDSSGNTAKDSVPITRVSLYNPQGIFLDRINNELWVANNDSNNLSLNKIIVYDRTDNGYPTPKRIINGSATGLYWPHGIAIDNINNETFVTNVGSVLVYDRTAIDNAAPIRSISGTSTGLSSDSVALDNVNDEILVGNSAGSITVYPRTANGDAAPIRTIGGASTGLSYPYGIAVDNINDEIFAANYSANSITIYSRTADGDVAPIRTISGASTGLSYPNAIAIDNVNNEIFVANNTNTITVYGRTADGDVVPIRTFNTSDYPKGIYVDNVANEVFVTEGYYSINVYPRTAIGNAAPIRTIH